jgi:hypothetical protein
MIDDYQVRLQMRANGLPITWAGISAAGGDHDGTDDGNMCYCGEGLDFYVPRVSVKWSPDVRPVYQSPYT